MDKQAILQQLSEQTEGFYRLSDFIWDAAEVRFTEYRSSRALAEAMEREGFTTQWNLAGMETAFRCSWGSGKPVIGFLAEYDALPNLSQCAGIAEKKPVTPGGNGHGCGHNLLGVGSLIGAIGAKRYLEANHLPGTIVLMGCPAEEGGSGKTFMAREGHFSDLDCALTWHPGNFNMVSTGIWLANSLIRYSFTGRASHAAGAPDLGRSALDALELMNVGIQFLREHVPSAARIHYAITDTGGDAPNVVQATASGLYMIRAPYTHTVTDIAQRLDKIAQGAALMTETKVSSRFVKAVSNTMPNTVLEQVMYRNLTAIPCPGNDSADQELAVELMRSALPEGERPEKPMEDFVHEYAPSEEPVPGSTDVGDVSWVCPVAQVWTAAWPVGTPGHSWQSVAGGKSDFAHRAMLYAGQVIAGSAIDLIDDPQLLTKAWEEFRDRTGGRPYQCPIPIEFTPNF